ncbi:MAG: nicotinate-nucleotide adenylyltransferase [Lachnospiraceae bacterium]|nr:nicotinate-nucleotide adenylyltransferase [Lachnospiraceae bacterium]
MRRIGILGGTFNPIHNGHVRIAAEAYEHFELDEVLLIPSGYSYMKNEAEIAAAESRLKMALLAVKDYPYMTVSDLEIKRKGPSFTYETINQLRETYNKEVFYFIIGADTLYNMENWKEPEDIFNNVIIAVKVREHDFAEITGKTDLIKQSDYLKAKYNAQISFLPGGKLNISSRLIREKISNNESISDLVPDDVAGYIAKFDLYNQAEV